MGLAVSTAPELETSLKLPDFGKTFLYLPGEASV